ncbi:RNA polymerase sigma factor [Porifericola rhodea]|uniref:RNA polymerase sigma factor n=1 Tax=Porifericola rhodea TaxID=930972 RepID=UPI0026664D14|nr:RNA polymerase sigma factor [Porifericola rhodea]WKN29854.1 RNA polymerase sigma factor [Porifericola rhodea]
MHDEKALVSGCAKGERAMQKELYDRFSGQMLAVCIRYCKSREDAEDILQEAFVKVFNNIESFRKESTLGYWIKRIVINTALNYHRKSVYLYPHFDIEDMHDIGDDDVTVSNHNYKDLLKLLQTLPQGCQVIFNLYAIEGYKHKEIAEMLNISEGTSKSQYARAKSLIKEMITETGEVKHG